MVVPLESDSGSVFFDESYGSVACVTFVTVNETLVFRFVIDRVTWHWPFVPVVQDTAPVDTLHFPDTVALPTGTPF